MLLFIEEIPWVLLVIPLNDKSAISHIQYLPSLLNLAMLVMIYILKADEYVLICDECHLQVLTRAQYMRQSELSSAWRRLHDEAKNASAVVHVERQVSLRFSVNVANQVLELSVVLA